jgi:hypothetical protein
MKNKKTTIIGYLTLAAAALGFIAAILSGQGLEMALGALALAIPGAGLVVSADGGH